MKKNNVDEEVETNAKSGLRRCLYKRLNWWLSRGTLYVV